MILKAVNNKKQYITVTYEQEHSTRDILQ